LRRIAQQRQLVTTAVGDPIERMLERMVMVDPGVEAGDSMDGRIDLQL
jgi:hypothetical protein